MAKLITKLKHEFLAMLPPTIFFYIALSYRYSVVHSLMLEGTGISVLSSASVRMRHLVLGKAVDCRHAADHQPLSPTGTDYNVTWKTLIYLMESLLAHLEHLVESLATDWRAGTG